MHNRRITAIIIPMNTINNAAQIIEQLNDELLVLRQQNAELDAKVKWYEEQFRLSQQRRFGSSSEKTDPMQLDLFNEAEDTADPKISEPGIETITYERKKRNPGQREDKLKDLPVEEIEYELEESEQICPCCQGNLHKMGAEIRQELKIIPAQVILVKHMEYKYA